MVATLSSDGNIPHHSDGTVTDADRDERHIALIGPTSVGKGYTLKKIRARLEKNKTEFHIISLGEMIRDRIEGDREFCSRHGQTVKEGELLPYDVVTEMVEREYARGRSKGSRVFIWDGYARDSQQMERMLSIWKCPREKHRIFFLKASEATCRSRLDEAIASKRRDARTDNDRFPERYGLHASNESHVINTAKSRRANHRVIDADRCLELVVADVLLHSMNLF